MKIKFTRLLILLICFLAIKADAQSLTQAVQAGDVATAESLLINGTDPNVADASGLTALYIASDRGDTAMVSMLLRHSANPNQSVTDNWTALIAASHRGYVAVVEQLLSAGADPRHQTAQNMNAFDYSVENSGSPGDPGDPLVDHDAVFNRLFIEISH
jgi:ankyrin repeat protein